MLERCGFEAQVAENGRKALEALSQRTYAAVLMDCQMPELDGYETTREIRRLEQGGPRMPIIAMTANAMQGERERCLAAGMDDYLTKPLRQRTLKDTLCALGRGSARAVGRPRRPGPANGAPGDDRGEFAAPRRGGRSPSSRALDGDVLGDLVTLYFDEAAGRLTDLGGAVDRADPDAVARMAHTLRGSSSTLGAAHVARIAAELETTAKRRRPRPPPPACSTRLRRRARGDQEGLPRPAAEPNNDGVFPL